MTNDIWNYIKEFIDSTLKLVQPKIGEEATRFVNHYLDHNEYEMAFELLFLEIIKLGDFTGINLVQGVMIGKMLNLNEESVFDFDFWNKLTMYCDKG